MNGKGVIFDVDGTLFDTGPGIKACLRAALEEVGGPTLDEQTLDTFIGPSLFRSFTGTAGLSEQDALRAVDAYRVRYRGGGIMQSQPYDGVPELLAALKSEGYALSVASSKPLVMVQTLLDAFGFTPYFARVIAPDFATRTDDKADLIRAAVVAPRSVMVGDTRFDIEGGHNAGLRVIWATYGYGKPESVTGADASAASPQEVLRLCRTSPALFEPYR